MTRRSCRIHSPGVRRGGAARLDGRFRRARSGHGLGTSDNPIFPGMHESAALIAGGSVAAALAIAHGEVDRAVNFFGGLHHAMPDYASGFCIYNDAALAIAALLDAGVQRVAYVDVDVHHGDGVQAAFYDDPRVLTVSIHETPLSLFPGTGWPAETGRGDAVGTAVNVAVPGRHVGCRVAAGVSRGRAGGGRGVPARGAGHPARRRHPPGGSARRPEPDRRRAADRPTWRCATLAEHGRPAAAGWRSAAAGTPWSGWSRGPGPICWRSLPDRDLDPATPLPADWIATAGRARPDIALPDRHVRRHNRVSSSYEPWDGEQRAGRRPGDPGHQEQDLPAARPRSPRSA